MNTKNYIPKFYSSALILATSLAGAWALTTPVSASTLDPTDPYQATAGQYPGMQHYSLPPQDCGQESIGMRQQRFATGQNTDVVEIGAGGQAVTGIETSQGANTSVAVNANVTLDEQRMSPVMRSIHQALRAVSATKGAVAVTDAKNIAPDLASAPYGTHTMLAVYQARIGVSSNAVESLQARSAQFAGDTQTQFANSISDVSTARAQLDSDFAAARSATPDNWDSVRANLSVDYKRYSDAAAKAESIGQGDRSS